MAEQMDKDDEIPDAIPDEEWNKKVKEKDLGRAQEELEISLVRQILGLELHQKPMCMDMNVGGNISKKGAAIDWKPKMRYVDCNLWAGKGFLIF